MLLWRGVGGTGGGGGGGGEQIESHFVRCNSSP